ncbi:hypothetical protein BYT27DRAFT_7264639 [Phlegmacium glaucopus]|nr:hypothetical protein BYT27DRAFT_7264639 [Phlegmacium glaucopus]
MIGYNGAKRHQQEMLMNGAERTIDYEEDAMPEDFMNESMASEPTEEDIAQAYESRGTMREQLYAQVTMNTAIECGVFSEGKADTVFLPTAGRADNEDLKTFIEWGEKLRAAVRNQVNSGGSGLFASDDGERVLTNDMIEGVEENLGKDVEVTLGDPSHQPATILRHKRSLLNKAQRRAHDIIEGQLLRRLAGNIFVNIDQCELTHETGR